MTSTSVTYQPYEDEDLVYHDKSNPDQQTISAIIRGSSEPLQENHAQALNALIGTNDVQKIIDIGNWYRTQPRHEPFLWRINPQNKTERAVVLGVDNVGGFVIDAYDDINDSRPALGVVCEHKAKQTPQI